MEKRIRPWINKKIIEYIGEPEPTLVDFICSKVMAGSSPQGILDDVQMVNDCCFVSYELKVIYNFFLLIVRCTISGIGRGSRSVCSQNVEVTNLRSGGKEDGLS